MFKHGPYVGAVGCAIDVDHDGVRLELGPLGSAARTQTVEAQT